METVKFGKTGMQVSKICLGWMTYGSTKWRDWVLEEEASRRSSAKRWSAASISSTRRTSFRRRSEEILGRALKEYANAGGGDRDQGARRDGSGRHAKGLSRKHIMEAIDASLRRLGTHYVDLYQIHCFDPRHRWRKRSRR